MNKNRIITILIFLALFAGCSQPQKNVQSVIVADSQHETYYQDSTSLQEIATDAMQLQKEKATVSDEQNNNTLLTLPPQRFTQLQGEIQYSDELMLKSPSQMIILMNHLLINDYQNDSILYSISLDNTGDIKRLAPVGQGPFDFNRIRNMHSNGKELTIMDLSNSYFEIKDNEIALDEKSFIRRDKVQGVLISPFGDGYVINAINGNRMLAYLNTEGDTISFFCEYPGDTLGIYDNRFFPIRKFYNFITSPNKKNLVVYGGYSDWLAFYTLTSDGIKKEKEYFSFETEFVIDMKAVPMQIGPNEKTTTTYKDLYATDSHLYALYDGYLTKETENIPHPTYIIQFSWRGDFQKAYRIKENVTHIAVDEQRSCIYATYTPKGEDPVLLKYEIK